MYALYSSYEKTGYGEMGSTEYVMATFDEKEDAKTYMKTQKGYKNHPWGYQVRKYSQPPHNPSPRIPKTQEQKKQEKIQQLEQKLKRLKRT